MYHTHYLSPVNSSAFWGNWSTCERKCTRKCNPPFFLFPSPNDGTSAVAVNTKSARVQHHFSPILSELNDHRVVLEAPDLKVKEVITAIIWQPTIVPTKDHVPNRQNQDQSIRELLDAHTEMMRDRWADVSWTFLY